MATPEERIAILETRADATDRGIQEIKETLSGMDRKLDSIISGRPTWIVASAITFLVTALGVAITQLVNVLGRVRS